MKAALLKGPAATAGIRTACLAGRVVRIPMRAPPFVHDMVGELAAAVMCGTKRTEACGVIYAESSRQLAALAG